MSVPWLAHASFERAADFLWSYGRVLERRRFVGQFSEDAIAAGIPLPGAPQAAPADGVLAALHAYRNHDGGFGHALEPD